MDAEAARHRQEVVDRDGTGQGLGVVQRTLRVAQDAHTVELRDPAVDRLVRGEDAIGREAGGEQGGDRLGERGEPVRRRETDPGGRRRGRSRPVSRPGWCRPPSARPLSTRAGRRLDEPVEVRGSRGPPCWSRRWKPWGPPCPRGVPSISAGRRPPRRCRRRRTRPSLLVVRHRTPGPPVDPETRHRDRGVAERGRRAAHLDDEARRVPRHPTTGPSRRGDRSPPTVARRGGTGPPSSAGRRGADRAAGPSPSSTRGGPRTPGTRRCRGASRRGRRERLPDVVRRRARVAARRSAASRPGQAQQHRDHGKPHRTADRRPAGDAPRPGHPVG